MDTLPKSAASQTLQLRSRRRRRNAKKARHWSFRVPGLGSEESGFWVEGLTALAQGCDSLGPLLRSRRASKNCKGEQSVEAHGAAFAQPAKAPSASAMHRSCRAAATWARAMEHRNFPGLLELEGSRSHRSSGTQASSSEKSRPTGGAPKWNAGELEAFSDESGEACMHACTHKRNSERSSRKSQKQTSGTAWHNMHQSRTHEHNQTQG